MGAEAGRARARGGGVPLDPPAGEPRLRWSGPRLSALPPAPAFELAETHLDGPPAGEPPNLLLHGDNLEALAWLLERGWAGRFRLVYLDPPFGTGARWSRRVAPRGPGPAPRVRVPVYEDVLGVDDYLAFLHPRLLALRTLLATDGSLVLHADKHRGHLLRLLLDEIFGAARFVNEIVWHYPDNFQGNVRGLANNHDVLLWYARGPAHVAHPVRVPLPRPVRRDRRRWDPATRSVVAARDASGRLAYDLHTHRKVDDVWRIGQSGVTKVRSREHTGYPTQKPLRLLERVVRMASHPGDLVLDPFLGSGTTAVAAWRLGRRWVGAEATEGGVRVALGRLHAAAAAGPGLAEPDGERPPPPLPPGIALRRCSAWARAPGGRLAARWEAGAVVLEGFEPPAALRDRFPDVSPWRLLDAVEVDPDHDGAVFRCRLRAEADAARVVPRRLDLPRRGERVRVRAIDLLGGVAETGV